jgi:hypothetical protein
LSKSHRIQLGGLDVIPDLSGALYVPDFATLLVADLHLEKGSSFARRGIHLPPYDTRASLDMLSAVTAAVKPSRLILLGDSFHDGEAHLRLVSDDLDRLRDLASRCETILISGNHDPAPPADFGAAVAREVALGPVTLRHVPGRLGSSEYEIAGHLHPAATIVQRGRQIRRRCFIGDGRRIVMPAFGSYTGALSITAPPFRDLFGSFEVWMIGERAIHRFPDSRVR